MATRIVYTGRDTNIKYHLLIKFRYPTFDVCLTHFLKCRAMSATHCV